MTSISGGISFSGLGSGGLDFEAMISQEKTIKEIPKKRLEAWQADWKLRYDAFDKLLTSWHGHGKRQRGRRHLCH